MAKQEQPSNGEEPEIKFAAAFHSATEYTRDGIKEEYTIVGNDREAIDHMSDRLQELSGGTVFEPNKKSSSKSHAMPGKEGWHAKWQPKGPNLSWQKPDQN
jgi:hypothetical protein